MQNGSYSGILGKLTLSLELIIGQNQKSHSSNPAGLLQRKEIDLYLKAETEFIDEKWLKKSNIFRTDNLVAGHAISLTNTSYFDLVRNFDLGFWMFAFYFVTILVGWLALLVLLHLTMPGKLPDGLGPGRRMQRSSKLKRKILWLTQILENYTDLSTFPPPIRVLLVFANLWFWFVTLFLIANIKTNKVVSLKVSKPSGLSFIASLSLFYY